MHAGGQGFEPLILHQDFGPKKEPRKPNNVYQTNTEEKRNRDNILSESLEICEGYIYDFNRENQKLFIEKLTMKAHSACALYRSSKEGHKADALALGAEEGRDKLR